MPKLIASKNIPNEKILEMLRTQGIKFKIEKNPAKEIMKLLNAGYTIVLQIRDKAIVFLQ